MAKAATRQLYSVWLAGKSFFRSISKTRPVYESGAMKKHDETMLLVGNSFMIPGIEINPEKHVWIK